MYSVHYAVRLTYSLVQSPSWEANWFVASQEIRRISRNPKVHYRTHNRPPLVSILDQPNPVHIPTSHLLEIQPNIIHSSTSRSPQWLFPSSFPSKTLYTPLLLTVNKADTALMGCHFFSPRCFPLTEVYIVVMPSEAQALWPVPVSRSLFRRCAGFLYPIFGSYFITACINLDMSVS